MEWPKAECLFFFFFFLVFIDVSSLINKHGFSEGAAGLSGRLGGSQQTLLRQVSLQGVEDVELLVGPQGQELLDHLTGVGAPERKQNRSQM